jgi:type II secretory pathway pseudopilin PulG
MFRSQPSRSGFTLFQLLIILALLALLFALLLPAVVKVRLAAARTQSINNLKQLVLAINNVAGNTATGVLPSGEDDNHFSVSAHLLPYIEQNNVYAMMDLKKSVDDKANAEARKLVIKTFLSPRDPVLKVNDDMAATNYLWNDKIFSLNSKPRFPGSFGGRTSAMIAVGETLKGDPFALAEDVRRRHVELKKADLKDLKDDAGVEDFKKGKHVVANRGASWMDGRFLQGRFNGSRALNDERPDVDCGGAGGLATLRSLDDLIFVGIGDGSVRALNAKNLSHKTFMWALDPSNNDPAPMDW